MMNYFNPYQQPVANSPITDDRQWVSNQQGAEAYPLQPNSFVRLWDSSKPVFYEKRTDISGRPFPVVAYRYEEAGSLQQNEPKSNPLEETLREELNALNERITALENKSKKKVKEISNDES